ncbi:hypothetical protein PoB_002818500 [Plakobranchus ocellatus]|uniref:Uncharacterized protein n=1 Tax=Plakobranchus ocellatus TaxID=259542 RepID=A0AAV4A495_9GAST|nr:hypothetical protein PoB_002818500 [Plakobranchus ocellatus]
MENFQKPSFAIFLPTLLVVLLLHSLTKCVAFEIFETRTFGKTLWVYLEVNDRLKPEELPGRTLHGVRFIFENQLAPNKSLDCLCNVYGRYRCYFGRSNARDNRRAREPQSIDVPTNSTIGRVDCAKHDGVIKDKLICKRPYGDARVCDVLKQDSLFSCISGVIVCYKYTGHCVMWCTIVGILKPDKILSISRPEFPCNQINQGNQILHLPETTVALIIFANIFVVSA